MARGNLTQRMAARAVGTQLAAGKRFDLGLGFALMRDGRVPVKTKAMAVGMGAAIMTGVVALELPLEGLIAMAIPMLGGGLDLLVDGAEETLGTMVVASLLLTKLAPAHVIAEIRAERG